MMVLFHFLRCLNFFKRCASWFTFQFKG